MNAGVIPRGVESGEILASAPSGSAERPEGQNLGALVAPCGSISPMVYRHTPFNHKVYSSESIYGKIGDYHLKVSKATEDKSGDLSLLPKSMHAP